MHRWTQFNEDVYYANSDVVSINSVDMNDLKRKLSQSNNKRVRICAHQTSQDSLHEMLIAIAKGSYVRPHKHINKGESFHMIEGALDVIIFNEKGDIINVIEMGAHGSQKNFFYRLSTHYFHTVSLKTDYVVFHETTSGPFCREDTVFASWSPLPGESQLVKKFMDELDKKADLFLEKRG
jgi:cupin fold WbuC family metalloprotein